MTLCLCVIFFRSSRFLRALRIRKERAEQLNGVKKQENDRGGGIRTHDLFVPNEAR